MFGLLELTLAATLAAVAAGDWRPEAEIPSFQSPASSLSARPPHTAQAPSNAGGSSPSTGPISGYMELHLNAPTDGTPAVLDFHRFVLLFTHSFSDRVRFVGELELEHAVVEGLEEGGELELEQAYLDFLVHPALNFRAGMLLVPVGIINERHEPPVFHGVERPFVDTVIIPTTWFEAGAGIHGALGKGFRYRAYAMAPLDATAFSAEEGLQGSAQHGSEAVVRNVAVTGRLEYVGVRGLQTGASFWAGDTGFNVPSIKTSVGLYEFDARLSRGRLEARGQLAHVFINGAGDLNDAMGRLTGIDPNIAEQLFGVYGEVAYRFLPASAPHDAAVFVRYENFDTQFKMPAGSLPLPQFDRDAWVIGGTYWVDPDVAIKFDYTHVRSGSTVVPPPRSVNIGLGWWF
jgi:hypothetical protein